MILLFTDVGGTDPELRKLLGEDEDTLRFLHDAAADLGVPLVKICDGRTIWDVFREKRWLGNASLAHCSWELKTGPARRWIEENAPGCERVLVGIDSTEIHRLPAITEKWAPYEVSAPLTERPLLWKPQLIRMLRERGIKPPRMYELGFGHANCSACVKGGIQHWIRLYRVWPERYSYAEEQEELLRAELGDVTILRDRRNRETVPLPLRELRRRIDAEQTDAFDLFEEGGCACFA
jgi:hypothetical protein